MSQRFQKKRLWAAGFICYMGLLLLLSYFLTPSWAAFGVTLGAGALLGVGVLLFLRANEARAEHRSSGGETLTTLDTQFQAWLQKSGRELQTFSQADQSDRYLNQYFIVFQADILTPLPDDGTANYTGLLSTVKHRIAQQVPDAAASISVSAVQRSIIGCVNYPKPVAGDPHTQALFINAFDAAQQTLRQHDGIDLIFTVSDMDLKQDEIAHGFRQLEDLHWYMDIFSYDPSGETVTLDLIQAYVLKTEDRAVQFQSRNLLQLEKHFITCVLDENFVSAKRLIHSIINQNLVESYSNPIECYHTAFEKVKGLIYDAIEATRLQMDAGFFSQIFPQYGITDVTTVPELQARCDFIFDQFIEYSSQKKADEPPKLYSQIEAYVNSHITDPALNISAIAMALGQHPSTISRVFKENAGAALLDYIHRRRVDIAKRKLEAGLTVARVAEETGFGSARSFTRAFQKLEGVSPGSYQEIHRSE